MSKICTDLEQSRKLVKMKLDKNTADMHYFSDGYNPTKLEVGYSAENAKFYRGTENEYTPAWSLSALLEIMPSKLGDNTNKIIKSELQKKYFCVYGLKLKNIHEEYGNSPIDAVFKMVVWLLENKHIK